MRRTVLALSFLLLARFLWTQGSSPNATESSAIQRVKAVLVSTLDSNLPKVTLEFFLKYEGGGAPIKWQVKDCGEQTGNPVSDHGRDPTVCVEADMDVKDRGVTVLVSVGKRDVPTVYGVRITDPNGPIHRLDRLGDLPVELHRPVPKGPKDLPPPVTAL